MIIELGNLSLVLALLSVLSQITIATLAINKFQFSIIYIRAATQAGLIASALILLSFFLLMISFINSDFSAGLVWQHSNTLKPLLYKISATWGNHEGSLLLWSTLIAVFFSIASRISSKQLNNEAVIEQSSPSSAAKKEQLAFSLLIQGIILLCLVALVIFTSNPFWRNIPAAAEGLGLNPILQDPALAIHPPLLYSGHAALAVVFAFATAVISPTRVALLKSDLFQNWVTAAWCLLTAGIAVGSWWAYHELGWGGWWFWDPVENSALLPWLMATALLHCVLVYRKRNALATWTIGFSIASFGSAILGTFLVRSGLLESVHSFASDKTRGIAIIFIFTLITGYACWKFMKHFNEINEETKFSKYSKEAFITYNNIAILFFAGVVFIGTTYPLIIEAFTGSTVAVGAPYFNSILIPLALPFILLMSIAPTTSWHRGDIKSIFKNSDIAITICIVTTILLVASMSSSQSLYSLIILAIASSSLIISLSTLVFSKNIEKINPSPKATTQELINNISKKPWRAHLAHASLALMIIGITGSTVLSTRNDISFVPNEKHQFLEYEISLGESGIRDKQNYRERFATVNFSSITNNSDNETDFSLTPSRRLYEVQNTITTEMDTHSNVLGTLITILDVADNREKINGITPIRIVVIFQPLAWMLWLGVALMIIIAATGLRRNQKQRNENTVTSAKVEINNETMLPQPLK